MMGIHHAGHAVESEAIELEFFDIEPQVAQQKAQHFMMAIIEEPAVPKFMTAFGTGMEILVIGAVELVQTIEDILGRMRVHNV